MCHMGVLNCMRVYVYHTRRVSEPKMAGAQRAPLCLPNFIKIRLIDPKFKLSIRGRKPNRINELNIVGP